MKMPNLSVILGILLVITVVIAGYFYSQYRSLAQNPQKIAQEETAALIERVGQLIVLPQGETPTVATVNDPDKLKDQQFFANAKEGFKVLIYTNAKKAILYDPVNHKIVEVAPLNIGNSAAQPSTGTIEQPSTETNEQPSN